MMRGMLWNTNLLHSLWRKRLDLWSRWTESFNSASEECRLWTMFKWAYRSVFLETNWTQMVPISFLLLKVPRTHRSSCIWRHRYSLTYTLSLDESSFDFLQFLYMPSFTSLILSSITSSITSSIMSSITSSITSLITSSTTSSMAFQHPLR